MDFYKANKDIKSMHNQWLSRNIVLEEAIKNNKTEIRLPAIKTATQYGVDDGPWASEIYSKYYGRIIIIEN